MPLQIDRRTIYHTVAEEIAISNFYETMTVAEIKNGLALHLAPEQVLTGLAKARKLGWIKYADNSVVYLTVRGRAHFSSYDPSPPRSVEERNADPEGRVKKHKLKGLITLRSQGKEVEEKELADDERARRRIRKHMRKKTRTSKTPKGERNPSGRIISDDWG